MTDSEWIDLLDSYRASPHETAHRGTDSQSSYPQIRSGFWLRDRNSAKQILFLAKSEPLAVVARSVKPWA